MKKKSNIIELKPLGELMKSKDRFDIFLAGSIENGKAEEWQKAFKDEIMKMRPQPSVGLFNPRRENWDPSWGDDNPELVKQIQWEISHLEKADLIVMYFDPNTKSPTSLLELGLFGRTGKLHVICPEGFWRKGNVDVVCNYYGIPLYETLTSFTNKLESL